MRRPSRCDHLAPELKGVGERPEALTRLALLLRSGLSLHTALVRWHEEASPSLRPQLERLARRLSLGDPPARAVGSLEAALGGDTRALAIVTAMHLRTGGDAAAMVESLAEWSRRRDTARGTARAAAAGMRLSGRVIACLPLFFVPVMPLTRSSLLDAPGIAMLVGGILLALAGLRSIDRLIPSVPDELDGALLVAILLATALRAGVGIRTALDVIATHGPEDLVEALRRARRLTRLGCNWSRSLQLVEEPRLAGIGEAVWRAESKGAPAAEALHEWVQANQDERAQSFEASVRRVPVLMVFPLTLFVLPSFFLLALGPFLRGLAQGS